MKVVLAFDSYKGSLSATQACAAAATGLTRIIPPLDIIHCPLSDGGEGFVEAIRIATAGDVCSMTVTGPMRHPTPAEMVFLDGGRTAVIEAAQACGLQLVPAEQRNPLYATTVGVGEMLSAAIDAGATQLIVGIGGSATNDAGMGMLTALGWQFLDDGGQALPPVGASLASVRQIVPGRTLDHITITVACDVTNPLFGPHGAAYTFAPQKGASPDDVARLDDGLKRFAEVCTITLGTDLSAYPGAGAAGGLGYALLAFLGARYRSGSELAIEVTGLTTHLQGADLCFTGEGQTDYQTAYGKLPAAVASCCSAQAVSCICLSGALGEGWRELYHAGFTALFSISQRPQSLTDALVEAPTALADMAEAVARVFHVRPAC